MKSSKARWSATGRPETVTDKVVVTKDDTSYIGRSLTDGKEIWKITSDTAPTVAGVSDLTASDSRIVGHSLVTSWKGKKAGAGLDAAKSVVAYVSYDLDTGKPIGNPFVAEENRYADLMPSAFESPLAMRAQGRYMVSGGKIANWSAVRGVDQSAILDMASQLVVVGEHRAVAIQTSTDSNYTFAVGRDNPYSRVGEPVKCTATRANSFQDEGGPTPSTNLRWVAMNGVVLNIETGGGRCLDSLSDQVESVASVSNAGDVAGTVGQKGFLLKHGDSTPTVVTSGRIPWWMPDGAAVFVSQEGFAVYDR